MKFAYADPPYIGQANKHYNDDPSGIPAVEVNHFNLVTDLCGFDGWALSLSSPSLKQVLSYCPDDVRVGAWVKPFASFKPGVNPAYAWEPVIFWGGRKRNRQQLTVRDWVSASITLERGTHGAKPEAFAMWLFELLGVEPGDTFLDMFPGSGAVSAAWDRWRSAMPLVVELEP